MKILQKTGLFTFILLMITGPLHAQSWNLNGNTGTIPNTNFVGTIDNQALVFKVYNQRAGFIGNDYAQARTSFGFQTLQNSSGVRNTAFGFRSMYLQLSGSYNTAVGAYALSAPSTGSGNTAFGSSALYLTKTGSNNVAIGNGALYNNSEGHNLVAVGDSALFYQALGTSPSCEFCDTSRLYQNTAIGSKALFRNTAGYNNTATGFQSLYWNNNASNNTANGYRSLYNNTSGYSNTAMGSYALGGNVGGTSNTAVGNSALAYSNASSNTAVGNYAMNQNYNGIQNSALGDNALFFNYTGSYNTGMGYHALYPNTGSAKNTAIGWSAGDFNVTTACTFVGHKASSTVANADNSTGVGFLAFVSASNQVRIGGNYVTSIGGYTGWSNVSDGRIKKNIQANVPGLEFINKLAPVTYNLDLDAAEKILQPGVSKEEKDGALQPTKAQADARKAKQQIVYTGFIAQDVEKAAKELKYDFSGVDAAKNEKDLYGLRYAEFVVPLVKAVQQLSAQNDELKKEVEALKVMVLVGAQNNMTQGNAAIAKTGESALAQNVPNPANGNTTISYYLPNSVAAAALLVTDISGRVLKTISLTTKGAGQVVLGTGDFAVGSYSYTLVADGHRVATRQMVLNR